MSPPVDAVARASAGGASKRVRRATVAATDEELTADESDAAERVEADAEAETEWMERKKEKLLSLQSTTIRQKKISTFVCERESTADSFTNRRTLHCLVVCLQLFNELIDHMVRYDCHAHEHASVLHDSYSVDWFVSSQTTREPAALSVGDGSDESSDADSRSGSGSSECDDDNDDDYHESVRNAAAACARERETCLTVRVDLS